jgi:hypothetical protein
VVSPPARDEDELEGDGLGDADPDLDPYRYGVGDESVDRAPICSDCGVTALPADLTHVLDTGFVCENPDCEAFGVPIG